MINARFGSVALLTTLCSLMAPSVVFANDADKAACAELTVDTDCVDGDGRAGKCISDDTDPVLTCEDLDSYNCIGLSENAACVDAAGQPGACIPDASDAGALHCEDNATPGDDSGEGGSGGDDSDGGGDDSGSDDTASEREADRIECAELSEGDSCTESDGDEGACKVDDSDPNVLECDDDAVASSSSASAGCSASGGDATSSGVLLLLGLSLAVAGRRRSVRG
jgi:MYXO-CTERM domain-containing protein